MKKIALIGPAYPMRGGIAHYTTLLSRELAKDNTLLHLSFKRLYPDWFFPGKSNYDPSNPPVEKCSDHPLIDSLNPMTWLAVIRRLRRFQPEMILFQWWVAYWAPLYLLLLAHLRNQPFPPEIVFICHNVVEHEGSIIKRAVSATVLSKAHRLITHSRAESRKLSALLHGNTRITTGFHPSYQDVGTPGPDKALAKKQLGLDGDVLLFFGFIRKYKGLDILLDALPHVKEKKKVTLLVVGEFWQDRRLYRSQIERLNIGAQVVIVDTYVPNERVGLYFAAADLVVLPYLQASGSGVCQLAFGHNRPVIATRVGSLPEAVDNRINGRLVSPGDSLALAGAIIESLDPKVLGVLTQNAAKVKDRFCWRRMAEIVLDRDIEGFADQP